MRPIDYALMEYGEKEIVGTTNNPRIVKYSTDIGNTWVTNDEVAWCSEFVNWCLLQAGITGTKSAVAKSFLKWGEETTTPSVGDLVIFNRPPDPAAGHIGFFCNEHNGKIYTLGGNQGNEVNISGYDKSRVLSYRKVPGKVESSNEVNSLLRQIISAQTILINLLKK